MSAFRALVLCIYFYLFQNIFGKSLICNMIEDKFLEASVRMSNFK